jgi:hypothetical protein
MLALDRPAHGLEAGIDRFALQRQDAEHALVDTPAWFPARETLERLNPERELAQGEPSLAAERPLPEPLRFSGVGTRGHR